jgi:EAL and modified HD-GYP domain-containing signal transduction protein
VATGAAAQVHRPALVHVGRQPILTSTGALYGYELLFRGTAQATASRVRGLAATPDAATPDGATTATILSAFSEFGGQLLGGRLGFVNLTRAFIVGHLPVPFPPSVAVLEVLETVEIDDAVIRGARARVAEGHRLALDDFVWSESARPLLELADIVKLDVLEPSWEEVLEAVERCKPYGVRLLAERVEDAATFAKALEAGFELFQGFHLGRPQTLSMESLGPGQAIALRMLARLSDPNTTARQVEELLRTDPALSFRLLRIANSAHTGLQRRVASIRDAVVLVGLARLQSWMVLIAMNPGRGQSERISSALVRAKTCELTAGRITASDRPDSAFTLGLLHGVAEALGVSPEAFVAGLPALADDLKAALIGDGGPLRTVLDSVLAYELADLERLSRNPGRGEGIAAAYVEALAWTTTTVGGIHERL